MKTEGIAAIVVTHASEETIGACLARVLASEGVTQVRVIDIGAFHGELFEALGPRLRAGFGVEPLLTAPRRGPRYTIEPQKRRLAARRAAGITDDSITTA